MKKVYLLITCMFFCLYFYGQPDIAIDEFGTGFTRPISIKNAGDDRLFIVEQDGFIQILNTDGSKNMVPFLDIDDLVIDISNGDERGLLGLAFHPNYATNGYFYVNYINNSNQTVISRFRVSANPDIADDTSELILLTYAQPLFNHNGGHLEFGPDGYLYISSGDGGGVGDPEDNSQDLSNLLGAILRIDVDNTSNGNNYAIPSDNPFIADANARDEIWAYGLRNPWKFSFDSQNGNLWIADVGQSTIEEINMISSSTSGVNFGWRCYEGSAEYNPTDCPAMNTLTFPVAEYSHEDSGNFKCSITGGYVHRGTINTDFNGYYFFADYCSNEIGTIDFDGNDFTISYSDRFGGNNWTALGEDINGELYIAGVTSGTIFKIVPGNLSLPEFTADSVSMFPNPTSNGVNFSFNNSIIPSEIAIFDIHGKLITSQHQFSSSAVSLSTENVSSGMYIVSISNSKGNTIYKKLAVQ